MKGKFPRQPCTTRRMFKDRRANNKSMPPTNHSTIPQQTGPSNQNSVLASQWKEVKKETLQTTLLHARFHHTWMRARIASSVCDKTKGEDTFTFGDAITFARFCLISAKCIGTYGGTYLAHCRARCLNTALGMLSPKEAYMTRTGCPKWLSPLKWTIENTATVLITWEI